MDWHCDFCLYDFNSDANPVCEICQTARKSVGGESKTAAVDKPLQLMPGWTQVFTPDGKPYYQNLTLNATQWEPPLAPGDSDVAATATVHDGASSQRTLSHNNGNAPLASPSSLNVEVDQDSNVSHSSNNSSPRFHKSSSQAHFVPLAKLEEQNDNDPVASSASSAVSASASNSGPVQYLLFSPFCFDYALLSPRFPASTFRWHLQSHLYCPGG